MKHLPSFYTHTHAHIHTYMGSHMNTNTHTRTHGHTHTHTHTHKHTHIHTPHKHAYTHHTHTHTHTHTYIHVLALFLKQKRIRQRELYFFFWTLRDAGSVPLLHFYTHTHIYIHSLTYTHTYTAHARKHTCILTYSPCFSYKTGYGRMSCLLMHSAMPAVSSMVWYKFSKVSSIVTIYSKLSSEPTFAKFCLKFAAMEKNEVKNSQTTDRCSIYCIEGLWSLLLRYVEKWYLEISAVEGHKRM